MDIIINAIIQRKKEGRKCNDIDEAEIKAFCKEFHKPDKQYRKVIEDIKLFFPIEYGEAMKEMKKNSKLLYTEIR